jgi:DNA-binding CsgD family transcriptional regulator
VTALRSPIFRDRTKERDRLGHLLQAVRAGESAALVIRGEAGIGKSALLEDCIERAAGFQVARIAGMQSEMEWPYAGLHQLCAPMLPEADHLPDPQRNALRVAFGFTSGVAPDRFMVALATLGLLAEVAQKRPLLTVVDDAQWLDAASGQVLGFVARRVLAESVLMLFGVREPTEDHDLAGLAELTLRGLADEDARALLEAATPGRVDPRVRDRIVAETRGNPLALVELPKDLTAAELAGGFIVPNRDLASHLEDRFLRRFEALPYTTQRLMLVAAADPTGDVALLWGAALTLGIESDAAAVTGALELVNIGAQVRFRHPLVRSAIYSGASPEDRRAVHLALAEATDRQTEPDRRAWHLALATEGTDELVAFELERSAGRAQARGGLAAAGALLQRSVALTQDPGRRTDRALAAAQAQMSAGVFGEAVRLVAAAEVDAQDELQRARIDLLRGQIAAAAGPGAEAPAQLLKAAKRLEPLDIILARETYLDAWGAAWFVGQFGPSGRLGEVAQAMQDAPTPAGPLGFSDLLLEGLSLLVTEGRSAATPTLREAVSAFPNAEIPVEKGLQWGGMAATAAAMLWDFESLHSVMDRQTELARRTGALAPLCITLTGNVFMIAWRGELAAATALAADTDALIAAIGLRQVPNSAAFIAALKGDEPHSSAFINAAIELANARREGYAAQVGLFAAAILSNGLARYEHAFLMSLQATSLAPELHLAGWALPELIEAAVRTGNKSVAADALERFSDCTKWCESDWGHGMFARCQALVSNDETAEEHYSEAVECLSRTALRPEHARAHLLYGEWLRRRRRRVDSRHQLRIAYDMFSDIGMLAFAERALRELQATGETVRKRQDDTRSDLTPQEEQIARLALEGRTNPEIGAQLYISVRTVEWHLHKIFTKLGITSRKGLRDALPAEAGTGTLII